MKPSALNSSPCGLPSPKYCQVGLRIRRVGEVYDVHEAADASEGLADVVRHAVRGEVAHVTLAANQLDIGFQDRVAAIGNVINGKVRPIELSNNEEVSTARSPHETLSARTKEAIQAGRYVHLLSRLARKS